jgi:hypothetical protein
MNFKKRRLTMKQVTYFEAMYQNKIVKMYVDSTEDFLTWCRILKHYDKNTVIIYVAYDDGTTFIEENYKKKIEL